MKENEINKSEESASKQDPVVGQETRTEKGAAAEHEMADDHQGTVAEEFKEAIQERAREDEQPHSSNFTLRKILGGDILTARLIRSQIWLVVLVVFFVILYISNRYSVQKNLLEIDRLNRELKDAKYKALSSSSMLTEKSRESHVIKLLQSSKDSTLKIPNQPPYIITVPKK